MCSCLVTYTATYLVAIPYLPFLGVNVLSQLHLPLSSRTVLRQEDQRTQTKRQASLKLLNNGHSLVKVFVIKIN